jgi:hypothetical protein
VPSSQGRFAKSKFVKPGLDGAVEASGATTILYGNPVALALEAETYRNGWDALQKMRFP